MAYEILLLSDFALLKFEEMDLSTLEQLLVVEHKRSGDVNEL